MVCCCKKSFLIILDIDIEASQNEDYVKFLDCNLLLFSFDKDNLDSYTFLSSEPISNFIETIYYLSYLDFYASLIESYVSLSLTFSDFFSDNDVFYYNIYTSPGLYTVTLSSHAGLISRNDFFFTSNQIQGMINNAKI
ncbi:MAG: hypothetical protein ACJAWW_001609 [Sulfurimonas sp.]|jgi:hypothetical protein